MKGGIDPQGDINPQNGHHQKEAKLDIPQLKSYILSQTGVAQFEPTFSKQRIIEPTFIERPSTQPSYTEPSLFGPTFTDPTYIKIPPPQTPYAPDYASWMDLST